MSKEIFDFSEALRRMKEGKKVRRNGCYFSLSINKYKETEYEVVEYPSTDELLTQIEELEAKINAGINELRRIL